jgi:hypothetical protein
LARHKNNKQNLYEFSISNTVNNSLIPTITFLQPNVLNHEDETLPIPLNPPTNFFDSLCMYKKTKGNNKKSTTTTTTKAIKILVNENNKQ